MRRNDTRNDDQRDNILHRALADAEAGWAVFPLGSNKRPVFEKCPDSEGLAGAELAAHASKCSRAGHGVYDAVTPRSRVISLFNAAPRSTTGYGIATGSASRLTVVDVDGPEGLAEAKRLGLTSEHIVRTGREADGWHLHYAIPPGVKVRSRQLAPGLELKGDGAYVAGPGSMHPSGRPYRIARGGEPSPAPEWLLEEPERTGAQRGAAGPISIDLDDRRLLKLARRSRTGKEFARLFYQGDTSGYPSHSEADWQLLRHLAYWTGGDVDRMAALFRQSALYRESKGAGYPERSARARMRTYRGSFYRPKGAPADAVAALADMGFWRELMAASWPGMSGPTQHNILAGLGLAAQEHGMPKGERVGVYMVEADLAQRAGCSVRTLRRNIPELRRAGWLEVRRAYRRRARLFVLKVPNAHSAQDDPTKSFTTLRRETVRDSSPVNLSTLGLVLKIRWAQARYAAMQGVGKTGGMLALHLLSAGPGGRTTAELAALTGRRSNNVRRNLDALAGLDLVAEHADGRYSLPADFFDRLHEELEARGLSESERLADAREEREAAAVVRLREEADASAGAVEPEPEESNAPESLLEVARNLTSEEHAHTEDDATRERLAIPREQFREARKWRRVDYLDALGMRRDVAIREVFGAESYHYLMILRDMDRDRERARQATARARARPGNPAPPSAGATA